MSEYDSQSFNLFRLPLLWFIVAALSAQIFIVFHGPDSIAAPRVAPVMAMADSAVAPAPQIYGQSLGAPAPVPVKVELPARQESKQTIVKAKPAAPVATTKPTPVRATSSIETVIQFAMAQLGKPYKWGGAGPNSFDCSGLVMVAFSKIGLKLPHYTKTLINYGKAVSRAALQRGDIVFPGSGHVAIYLGNNTMIHAPQPGDVVKVSKVYAFYAGRRLA